MKPDLLKNPQQQQSQEKPATGIFPDSGTETNQSGIFARPTFESETETGPSPGREDLQPEIFGTDSISRTRTRTWAWAQTRTKAQASRAADRRSTANTGRGISQNSGKASKPKPKPKPEPTSGTISGSFEAKTDSSDREPWAKTGFKASSEPVL